MRAKVVLEQNEKVDKLWVFDDWVVFRTNKNNTSFFEKTLIRGYTNSLKYEMIIANNITMVTQFDTVTFGRDELNSSRCFMYGVAEAVVYKYEYFVNADKKQVTVEKVTKIPYKAFSGKVYDSIVTKNYYIVSCADCQTGLVDIFSHNLELQQTFDYGNATQDRINLAVSEINRRNM